MGRPQQAKHRIPILDIELIIVVVAQLMSIELL